MSNGSFDAPNGLDGDEDAAMPYDPPEESGPEVLAAFEAEYLGQDGIEGVGLATGPTGDDALIVYCEHSGVARRLPKEYRGYPVRPEITGGIDAQRG